MHLHWETLLLFALTLFALAYLIGVYRLWRTAGTGRGIAWFNVAAFVGAMLLLILALASPLAEAAEVMFSAHMVVHEILMVMAAPLLMISRPIPALAWAAPRLAATLRSNKMLNTGWMNWIATPLSATLIQAVIIWFWHVPQMFRAATSSEAVHVLQHLCFFGSALLFWHAIHKAGRVKSGAAVGYLFITSVHTNFLGALLTLSSQVLYPAHSGFGLSQLEDQQMGGIIMWVPGGMAYALAALAVAARWISPSGAEYGPLERSPE
jgi:putative membrane protein